MLAPCMAGHPEPGWNRLCRTPWHLLHSHDLRAPQMAPAGQICVCTAMTSLCASLGSTAVGRWGVPTHRSHTGGFWGLVGGMKVTVLVSCACLAKRFPVCCHLVSLAEHDGKHMPFSWLLNVQVVPPEAHRPHFQQPPPAHLPLGTLGDVWPAAWGGIRRGSRDRGSCSACSSITTCFSWGLQQVRGSSRRGYGRSGRRK